MISEDSNQAIEHGMARLVQSGEIKPGLEIAYWHKIVIITCLLRFFIRAFWRFRGSCGIALSSSW